jgi:hypothetical protein
MVLDDEPIFENCLIKTTKKPVIESISDLKEELESLEDIKLDHNNSESNNITDDFDLEKVDQLEETNIENSLEELEPFDLAEPDSESKNNNISLDLEIEDLNEDIEENIDELKEVNNLNLPLENNLETILLKKPNQVYFELYKEARNKAKLAKKNALLAYLEAKNIKKTYLIENLNDSDSDIDAEIDDVSESELEGL